MTNSLTSENSMFMTIMGWGFGLAVLATGLFNIILIHPVPGIIYLLLSIIYFPFTNVFLRKKFGFSIPIFVKYILAIFIILFTLGVSDLGDMID